MNIIPRHYRNMKWSMLPRNKIDTVVMSPISNTSPDTAEVFHTVELTAATIRGSSINLPVEDTTIDTDWHCVYNEYTGIPFAKGYVGCVMATGSQDFYVDTPVQGDVTAQLTLEGTSSVIDKGEGNWDTFPSISDLLPTYNLTSWVKTNRTSQSNALSWMYDQVDGFSLNPFVRNFKPWSPYPDPFQPDAITTSDVVTEWYNVDNLGRSAANLANSWFELGSDLPGSKIIMVSMNGYYSSGVFVPNGLIYLRDIRGAMFLRLVKYDDHNYHIDFQVPVRVTYTAASRTVNLLNSNTRTNIDNYAFVDNVTKISIALSGKPFSTDVVETSYSLAGSVLTDQVSNLNPFKIDAGELLTLGSMYDNDLWTEAMALRLLTNYKKGKYYVTLDVPATWAVQNNLRIRGETHKIINQDGSTIQRDGVDCNFYICNITKKFNAGEFTYTLGLVEV